MKTKRVPEYDRALCARNPGFRTRLEIYLSVLLNKLAPLTTVRLFGGDSTLILTEIIGR